MPKRSETRTKFARWIIYFPKKPLVGIWKGTLRKIVESGKAKVTFCDASQRRVELVWPKAVTYGSPARLVRLAQEETRSFEILGEPIGLAGDVGIAADEGAAAATPETKVRRINDCRLSTTPASPEHVVPPADDALAATPQSCKSGTPLA